MPIAARVKDPVSAKMVTKNQLAMLTKARNKTDGRITVSTTPEWRVAGLLVTMGLMRRATSVSRAQPGVFLVELTMLGRGPQAMAAPAHQPMPSSLQTAI